MWNALKNSLVRVFVVIVRGFVCWMELLGKHPGLSRDQGLEVWNELHKRTRQAAGEETELPAGEIRRRALPSRASWKRMYRRGPAERALLPLRTRHDRWRRSGATHNSLFVSH